MTLAGEEPGVPPGHDGAGAQDGRGRPSLHRAATPMIYSFDYT